jgi:BMFP domain-containing protein YqiC
MTQTTNRFLDEFAKLMTDAAGAADGLRKEAETFFKAQGEKILRDMDVVRREEFEAVKAMAERRVPRTSDTKRAYLRWRHNSRSAAPRESPIVQVPAHWPWTMPGRTCDSWSRLFSSPPLIAYVAMWCRVALYRLRKKTTARQ